MRTKLNERKMRGGREGGKERKRNGRRKEERKKEKENNTERKENVMINGFILSGVQGKPFQI